MIDKIYYDTPSGNISLTFVEEHSYLPKPYVDVKAIKYNTKSEIYLDIDEVRELFKLTKEFLDWYDRYDDETLTETFK